MFLAMFQNSAPAMQHGMRYGMRSTAPLHFCHVLLSYTCIFHTGRQDFAYPSSVAAHRALLQGLAAPRLRRLCRVLRRAWGRQARQNKRETHQQQLELCPAALLLAAAMTRRTFNDIELMPQ